MNYIVICVLLSGFVSLTRSMFGSSAKNKQKPNASTEPNTSRIPCLSVIFVSLDGKENGKQLVTLMAQFERDSKQITLADSLILKAGHSTIDNWLLNRPSTYIRTRYKSGSTTIQTNDGVRLDCQGKYVNTEDFQLQVNKELRNVDPASIAHVQVQSSMLNMNEQEQKAIIAWALRSSLETGGLVMVYQQLLNIDERPCCPNRNYLSSNKS